MPVCRVVLIFLAIVPFLNGINGITEQSDLRGKEGTEDSELDRTIRAADDSGSAPTSADVTSAVQREVEKQRDKVNVCIGRIGTSAYYDPELHSCGDCLRDDCLQNHICEQECRQFLHSRDMETKLNKTMEDFETFKQEAEERFDNLTDEVVFLRVQVQEIPKLQAENKRLGTKVQSIQDMDVPSRLDDLKDDYKNLNEKFDHQGKLLVGAYVVIVLHVICSALAGLAAYIFWPRRQSEKTWNHQPSPDGIMPASNEDVSGSSSTVQTESTTEQAPQQETASSPPQADEQVNLLIQEDPQ